MNSVPELRKKAAARASAKKQMYSTSQARANFAEALGIAQLENTVIGFDRYGRLVAAVVPIAAVRMLAGQASAVEPAVREKIERMARLFLHDVPAPSVARGVREERAAFEPKPRKKKKLKKKKKAKAKAARAKRPPRVSRKI